MLEDLGCNFLFFKILASSGNDPIDSKPIKIFFKDWIIWITVYQNFLEGDTLYPV